MENTSFPDLLMRLRCAASVSECLQVLVDSRELAESGIVGFREGRNRPAVDRMPRPIWWSERMGWPKGFMRNWLRMNLAGLDPALTGSDARPGRIARWSLHEFRTHSRSTVSPSDRLAAIEFLAQYGIMNGAVAAVRRQNGEIGYVSWLMPIDAGQPMPTAGRARALVLLAEVFFEALDRVRPSDPIGLLTETERRCLEGAAYGCTDKEIASDIQRTPDTVRFHMKNILKKLGAANRTHAVAVALQRGVIRLGGAPPTRANRRRSKAPP